MRIFILGASLLILFSLGGHGQIQGWKIHPNIGYSSYGILLGATSAVHLGNWIWSLDYHFVEEARSCRFCYRGTINQIGMMINKFTESSWSRLSYGIGFSPVWGKKRESESDSGERGPYYTVGIPVKLGFELLPSRFAGFGVDLMANLNLVQPYIGMVLGLEFGNLRKRHE